MPSSPWIAAQTWCDLLFVHWPLDVGALRSVLPEPLPLDLYSGVAWLSAVVFGVKNFRPRWFPPLPRLSNFPQINLRTYVTIDDKPGIYTFTLDVNNPLAVLGARLVYHLPYNKAHITMSSQHHQYQFHSRRQGAEFKVLYKPDDSPKHHEAGTLDQWLTERYSLYSVDSRRKVYRTDIRHTPWELQTAESHIQINTLSAAQGIQPTTEAALCHFAHRKDIVMWLPTRLQ